MAREIVTWCDVCLDNDADARMEGKPLAISIGSTSMQVDLCDTHESQLVKPLRDVLTTFGVKVNSAKADSEPGEARVACPQCNKTSRNRTALQTHCRHRHGQTLEQILGTAKYDCPDGNCKMAFASVQGTMLHIGRSHKWSDTKRQAWLKTVRQEAAAARS